MTEVSCPRLGQQYTCWPFGGSIDDKEQLQDAFFGEPGAPVPSVDPKDLEKVRRAAQEIDARRRAQWVACAETIFATTRC
jgi:hypothetical protein